MLPPPTAPIRKAMQTWFMIRTAATRHIAARGGGVIIGISVNVAREAYVNMGGSAPGIGA